MHKLQKGYLAPAAIIILALIVFSVAATIFFNAKLLKNVENKPAPSPETTPFASISLTDETAIRKTHKISYDFPVGWTKVEEDLDQRLFPPGVSTDGIGWKIWIKASESTRGIKVSDPIGTKVLIANKVFERKTGDIVIDNVKAATIKNDVLSDSGTDGLARTGVKIPFEGKVLYIWLMCEEKNSCQNYKHVFDQILTSFKFTN